MRGLRLEGRGGDFGLFELHQYNYKLGMKVRIKSVLKSSSLRFKWLEDLLTVTVAGNNMCIGQLGKPPSDFIPFHLNNSHLYDLAVSPNRQTIFAAEKNHQANRIQISAYSVSGSYDRKMFALSQYGNYMPLNSISSIELCSDQFESMVVYVVTKNKSAEACISLIDLSKGRVLAHGFVGAFDSFRMCSLETYEVSIGSKFSLKKMRVMDGMWNVEQRLPKKLQNLHVLHHEWLLGDRLMVASDTALHIVESGEVIQSITVTSGEEKITHTRKINRALLIFSSDMYLRLYIEDGEESLYVLAETLALPFRQVQQNPNIPLEEQQEQILSIEINKRQEDIVIITSGGKMYSSKIEEALGANKEHYFHFQKQQNKHYEEDSPGTICTSSGQNYCLVSNARKIQLWDMSKVNPLIKLKLSSIETNQVVRCSALNPDGHSFCIGFHDKIKFYRILINKFRQYAEYSLKKTKVVQYSHGGQLMACASGKGAASILTIFNTLSMREVHTFKLGFHISQIVWNEYDDEVYVTGTETKTLTIFRVSTKTKVHSQAFEEKVEFVRYDYLTKSILVSSGPVIYQIKPNYECQEVKPQVSDFEYIFPVEGIYLAVGKTGCLYISHFINLQKYQRIPLFQNEPFKLQYHKGSLIAYVTPSNSFVLSLKTGQNTQMEKKEEVVLVEREEISKFFEKVKTLESQLEQMSNITAIKLQEERKKYNESLEENSQNFRKEILFIQNRFNELQTEKSHQEKDNARLFEDLQSGQMKSVNDLEKVYDLKLKLQKEKYLALEQENLEQKMKYENLIKELETKYHDDVEKVRQEYSNKLQQELKGMESEKNRNLEYKRKVETKIIDLEEQSELTLLELQLAKDTQIKNLIGKQIKLEREQDITLIELNNVNEQLQALREKYEKSHEQVRESEIAIKESLSRVRILEDEISKKNKIIQDKNTMIEQQSHQIEALEKAKYVLSFRTTEIRKGLEPKDNLIDKLKSEFFKLEEEYKKESHLNFELKQKLEKNEKLLTTLRKEHNELKNTAKLKDRQHEELCYELFILVNNVDPKEWNVGLVKLYQTYAQEEKHKSKTQKKNDNTSEEINRHLIHVQQSLHQVATGNEKMLKGKEMEVVRKMKENAELVFDLNVMRKEKNQIASELKEREIEIARLKRELHEAGKAQRSTRANTANTGITRRVVTRDPTNQANTDWVDLSVRRQSDYLIPNKSRKDRILSAHKTMVWRDDSRKERSRISDLAKELESAKNTIKRQDRMIEELNQQLLGMPEEQLN